jgi:hypothetical protein
MFIKVQTDDESDVIFPKFISNKAFDALDDALKQYYYYRNEHLPCCEFDFFEIHIAEEDEIMDEWKKEHYV